MAVSEYVPWEADSEVNFNRQDIYYGVPLVSKSMEGRGKKQN